MVNLYLFNGAGSAEELRGIDDWGPAEITLGPFDLIQITYRQHIKCYKGNDVLEFWWDGDLVSHEGKMYGDFIIESV